MFLPLLKEFQKSRSVLQSISRVFEFFWKGGGFTFLKQFQLLKVWEFYPFETEFHYSDLPYKKDLSRFLEFVWKGKHILQHTVDIWVIQKIGKNNHFITEYTR